MGTTTTTREWIESQEAEVRRFEHAALAIEAAVGDLRRYGEYQHAAALASTARCDRAMGSMLREQVARDRSAIARLAATDATDRPDEREEYGDVTLQCADCMAECIVDYDATSTRCEVCGSPVTAD